MRGIYLRLDIFKLILLPLFCSHHNPLWKMIHFTDTSSMIDMTCSWQAQEEQGVDAAAYGAEKLSLRRDRRNSLPCTGPYASFWDTTEEVTRPIVAFVYDIFSLRCHVKQLRGPS